MFKFFWNNRLLFLIIFFATLQLSQGLDKPFIGHHDWNGAFWGGLTRNYLIYLESDNFLRYYPSNLIFSHYTPLLPLLFTFISKILGLSEYSLRLVPVLFSVALVVFVYKIGKDLYGELVGLLAAIFLIVTPMFVYFGKLPDHEPIVTSLIIITFYFFIRNAHKKSKNNYLLFSIFLFLALFESWPAFFLLLPITLIAFFVRKEKVSRILWPFAVAMVVVVVHLLLVFASQGWVGVNGFFSSGIGRSNTAEIYFGATKYTPVAFVITEARYAAIYFTRILLFMSGLYFLGWLFRAGTRKTTRGDIYLISLLIYPVCFIFTFRSLAFIHDYKLYHFLPFICLSSAVLLVHLIDLVKNHFRKTEFSRLVVKFSLICFVILVIAAVYFERLPYLKTLQATSFNYPGYELGNLIRQNTGKNDRVFVNSGEFNQFFGVFVDFYAQRVVDYGDLKFDDFKKNTEFYEEYKFIIVVLDKNYDKELLEFMSVNLNRVDKGNFVFFSRPE